MYVCVNIYIYIYMYLCMYVYIYIYVCMCIYIYICIYVCMYVCVYIYIYVCMCKYIYVCIYILDSIIVVWLSLFPYTISQHIPTFKSSQDWSQLHSNAAKLSSAQQLQPLLRAGIRRLVQHERHGEMLADVTGGAAKDGGSLDRSR